ncbi:bifunctional folylpolyglutamate synthase/dihydrofolate synthase [Rickettsiales endosymbiont of Peranema trichophorum]|nr:bifunctional folylpolyglutamate synthase/dihydrofolate synthase [Rickettsiales endosymbiont of Peranema trichophorum]
MRLDVMHKLLDALGNPHHSLPPVVHIAGTNGKGSTLAYLKAVLEAAGYKVHRYTSPHLVRFNERITLAGEEIDDGFLYEVIEETRQAAGDLQVSFFEGTTAAAFLAFHKVKGDILLLETGMGGIFDATNVVDKPLLTIITPISYDHMEYLGNTLTSIALEKAGIIKPNVPCIISWQFQEALEVLKARCRQLHASYSAFGEHWQFEVLKDRFNFIDLESNENNSYSFPLPSLVGPHQIINVSTAIAALQGMNQFEFTMEHIVQGITNAVWPARLEQIKRGVLYSMLPQGWELWLDGAHNEAGAQMLSVVADQWQDRPLFLINGRTGNRDIKAFLRHFEDKVALVIGVEVQSEPLAEKAEKIVAGALELGFKAIEMSSVASAIQHCIDNTTVPSRILICGSLYLAGDVIAANHA